MLYIRGGPFDNWGGGVEENVPEHFIYFFQEQRIFFYLTRSEKQFLFLYNKIGSNFFFALLTLDLLVVSLKFVCTGYVAECLVLVTLVHMPQRMGGRFGLGS